MSPGARAVDVWTLLMVTVVFGAQPAGFTTVLFDSGETAEIRTACLIPVS